MRERRIRYGGLRALVFAAGVAAAIGNAEAGGFAVREQSTSGLGAAFAGVAAGYDLSSIYWNPAGVSIARGFRAESHGALFLPDTQLTGTAVLEPVGGGSMPLPFLSANGGEFAGPALIGAMYAAKPINNRLTAGVALNSPFALPTEADNNNWAGKFEARSSRLVTYNLNPVASYRVTPNLAVGAGVQIEFVDATLKSAFPGIGGLAGPNPSLVINGEDYAVGYTLGLLWRPLAGTRVGLGLRSSIEHTLEGDMFLAGLDVLGVAGISADLETPEIVTGSLRQRVGERVTLLGTFEWTNWTDLDRVVVKARTGNALFGAVPGGVVAVLPLDWDEGWFASGGVEFRFNEKTTLRSGLAYEDSPIDAATSRTTRVPDDDRVWASFGITRKFGAMTTVDLGYTHIFVDDAPIDRVTGIPGVGQVRLLAEAEQDFDILAFSAKFRLGRPAPSVPAPE